jgi:hypothetical protein
MMSCDVFADAVIIEQFICNVESVVNWNFDIGL